MTTKKNKKYWFILKPSFFSFLYLYYLEKKF